MSHTMITCPGCRSAIRYNAQSGRSEIRCLRCRAVLSVSSDGAVRVLQAGRSGSGSSPQKAAASESDSQEDRLRLRRSVGRSDPQVPRPETGDPAAETELSVDGDLREQARSDRSGSQRRPAAGRSSEAFGLSAAAKKSLPAASRLRSRDVARSQLPFFFVGLLLGAVTGLAILWMASQNAFSESSSGPAVPGGMAPRAAAICGLGGVSGAETGAGTWRCRPTGQATSCDLLRLICHDPEHSGDVLRIAATGETGCFL